MRNIEEFDIANFRSLARSWLYSLQQYEPQALVVGQYSTFSSRVGILRCCAVGAIGSVASGAPLEDWISELHARTKRNRALGLLLDMVIERNDRFKGSEEERFKYMVLELQK